MFTLLCLLILYLPFQIALNPVLGIDLASGRIFILFLFLLWIFWSLKNKKFRIANNVITYFLLSFLFFSSLSMFVSDSLDRSLRKIVFFLSIFPLYFIVVSVVDNKEKVEKVLNYLIFSAVVASFIGILQFILQFFIGISPIMNLWQKLAIIFYGQSFGAEIISNPSWLVSISGSTYLRAFAFFPDPHMMSFYLGMVIPLAVARISNLEFRILKILVVFILITAQILTFSRGGYVGFGLFLLFYLVVFIFKNFKIRNLFKIQNSKFKIKMLFFIIILLSMVSLLFIENPISERISSIFDYKEGSNAGRIEIWKESLDVSRDNFLLGVGIGNYSHYLYPATEYRTPIYAHNTYLDILSEMGIFALVAWGMMFMVVLKFAIFNSHDKKNENLNIENLFKIQNSKFKITLAGSLIWFSGHAFFDTPIYSAQVLPLLMIILGLSSCIIYWRLE